MKIAKYLAVPLVLVGLGLAAWNSPMNKVEPVALDDTKATSAAYQKAVELDPDNAEAWNELGKLFFYTGQLAQAEEAFRKELTLGEAYQNKEWQAKAYGNLGAVYWTCGELNQAEQMYRKTMALYEALGKREGIAKTYSGLGMVYQKRGNLDQAEQMHRKNLEISEVLESRKGMARGYGNLGLLYEKRGDIDQAEALWKQSLSLYQEMQTIQHPNAKIIQQWLDDLALYKAGSSR